MKVWTRLESYAPDSARPLILALGNFDGVHLGHQKILASVIQQARKARGIPAVLTFNEHPQRVLHHAEAPALLTSPQHRLYLFDQLGIELCFLLPFTLAFSRTPPEKFIEDLFVNRLKVRAIHMGYNAHFGAERRGDGALMKKLARLMGFDFFEVEPVKVKNTYVSSTLIRQALLRGDLEVASEYLGRSFGMFATVVRGKGRGKTLGFPTANLQPHCEILPPCGVYPARMRVQAFHLQPVRGKRRLFEYQKEEPGDWRTGILNLGSRPTFEKTSGVVVPEVHLFDFTGNLYGETVEAVFCRRLREEREFNSRSELVQAIRQDVIRAREYFK